MKKIILSTVLFLILVSPVFAEIVGKEVSYSDNGVTLKGYLAYNKIRFDKTHDIEVLANLVRAIDPLLADTILPGKVLSIYAVRIRYPEEVDDKIVTKSDRDLALNLASLILNSCAHQIPAGTTLLADD